MNNYKWHLAKTNNGLVKPKSVMGVASSRPGVQGGSLYKKSVVMGGSITSLDQVNDDKFKVNVGGIQVKSGEAMTYSLLNNINPNTIPDALPTGKAGRRKKGGSFNF